MSMKKRGSSRRVRRRFTEEFKQEAVGMLLDGQAAGTVADRLGLSGTNILYQWKKALIGRGGQYAGSEYRAVLRRTDIRQSMSRAANCYDNAFMESCFGTIKTELEMTEYDSITAARREISAYIAYDNNSRRHSSIGYLTPTEFERYMRAQNSDSHCP